MKGIIKKLWLSSTNYSSRFLVAKHTLWPWFASLLLLFFFAVLFPKAAVVAVPLTCIAAGAALYKIYRDSKIASGHSIDAQNIQ